MSYGDPTIDAALRRVTDALRAEFPEFGAVLDEGRAAGLPEAEVMARVQALVSARPEIAERMQQIALEAMAPLREPEVHPLIESQSIKAVTEIDDAKFLKALDEVERQIPAPANWTDSAPTPAVIPDPAGRGRPRLNPAYEAHLHERLQFDGDAPELRTGPKPPEARPAVAVDTTARDPVALGAMLETASDEVAAEFRRIEAAREDAIAALGEDRVDALVRAGDQAALALVDRNTLPDPDGYERGRLPAPRKVEALDGGGLAALTTEQRHQLAWRFLSTTQGRRSATSVILELLAVKLRGEGHDVIAEGTPAEDVPLDAVMAHATWTVALSGPNGTQPAFSFIDIAAAALAHKLADILAPGAGNGAVLEVVEVNTVDVRSVGWAARVRRA